MAHAAVAARAPVASAAVPTAISAMPTTRAAAFGQGTRRSWSIAAPAARGEAILTVPEHTRRTAAAWTMLLRDDTRDPSATPARRPWVRPPRGGSDGASVSEY